MASILVTGGAGFIGSHLVEALLREGHRVRVLDSFVPQVHGDATAHLNPHVELIRADVRDTEALAKALDGIEVVYHLAAEVGVGQSMYEIERYVGANTFGTSMLLESLLPRREQIHKLVVASSMSIYGEGAYRCPHCGLQSPALRSVADMKKQRWEMPCPSCAAELEPVPTPESKTLDPASVYAITKQDQEQLCLVVGRAYSIPTVALRFFNVYGPGQALSNPYTGVMAIFSSRLLNQQPPVVFEDGLQTRDFVHVSDIVRANLLAMQSDSANYHAINVGTGVATSVKQVAHLLANGLGVAIEPSVMGQYREGDIRHCVADISRAQSLLGYEPKIALADGIRQLIEWTGGQAAADNIEKATNELKSRGLVH